MGNLANRYVDASPQGQDDVAKREPVAQVANKRVANTQAVANKAANKPMRDRKEYQRELMRKRRSKAKSA